MRTIDLDSWSAFPDAVDEVRRDLTGDQSNLPLIFRGHADATWDLDTTLERRTDKSYSVETYVRLATRYAHELRSITGQIWETPKFHEIKAILAAEESGSRVYLPCYSYLLYLRHHGFASPILDWTQSPFVAAYFAFHDPQPREDRAAVLIFADSPSGVKAGMAGAPMIQMHGPFVDTHRRHFIQRAWYTTCTAWRGEEGEEQHEFVPHSGVLDHGDEKQDVLVKITIPRSEREVALRYLDDFNISHFTLFQTDDSLVRSLDIRAFDLSGKERL